MLLVVVGVLSLCMVVCASGIAVLWPKQASNVETLSIMYAAYICYIDEQKPIPQGFPKNNDEDENNVNEFTNERGAITNTG